MSTTTLSTETPPSALPNPHDTPVAAGTRFAMELLAWSAGPMAVHHATGSMTLAALSLAALLAAPSLFNTDGDKHQDGPVRTPGPVRLGIELGLLTVAVGGAAVVWPAPVTAGIAATAMATLITGARRSRWLLTGE